MPPERDPAKLFGVSRPTLRAGIRSLTTAGILQSRQGARTFVIEAGGFASDGKRGDFGRVPNGFHERTPLIVGGKIEMREFEKFCP